MLDIPYVVFAPPTSQPAFATVEQGSDEKLGLENIAECEPELREEDARHL
jgi:hypothetical protein